MLIKLKARLYRYTGVYIAEKDEKKYLLSQNYWKDYKQIRSEYKKLYTPDEYKEILLNAWNYNNGFVRPLTKYEKFDENTVSFSIITKIKHHLEMIKLAFLLDIIYLYNNVLYYLNNVTINEKE